MRLALSAGGFRSSFEFCFWAPIIAQMELYKGFAQTGSSLTWQAVDNIETQALVQAGMNQNIARQTVQTAISELQKAGVDGPTRIPWGGK